MLWHYFQNVYIRGSSIIGKSVRWSTVFIILKGHNKSQHCSVVLPPPYLTDPQNDLYDKAAPSEMVFCFPISSELNCAQRIEPHQPLRPQLAPKGEQGVYAVWHIASITSCKAQQSSLWSVTQKKTTLILNFFIPYVTIFSYIRSLMICPTLFALFPSLN